jgi:MFS family permease
MTETGAEHKSPLSAGEDTQPAASAIASRLATVREGPEPHKWWTLVTVCLGTFMLLLDITIVNVALPDIQSSLSASFSGLQWVVDAYALTLASLLLTAGSLADLYGRRRLYVVGLVVFTLASLLCGVAGSTLLLQLARALQGVGGAIMFSVSLALLADAFRGKDRGTAFGIWGAVTGLAVAIGFSWSTCRSASLPCFWPLRALPSQDRHRLIARTGLASSYLRQHCLAWCTG